jgi:hypothetical protein
MAGVGGLMVAAAELAVPVDGDVAGDDAADEHPAPGRRTGSALFAAAVMVPVALFTWRALRAPVNFDGGMNLQVAESLAHGDGYTRFYDELRAFPHEIHTNGPFMYTAALGILVLGENQFAYQLANLLAIAGLAAAVFLLLRDHHPALRLAGPALVLLTAPTISVYGLGALGEVPITAFVLAAVVALGAAVRTPAQAPRWVFVAALAFGAALATKTFAQGAAPAFAVGLACALVGAPSGRVRVRALAATAGVVLVPALRELHRLIGLESVDGWRAWWAQERGSIARQSGLTSGRRGGNDWTFFDRMHVLSGLVDFPAELLLGVLVLPLAAVAALFAWRWRTRGLRPTLTDPAMAVLLMVSVLAATYISWWLLFVPEHKAWTRRIMPGLLALSLVYLLLVPWAVRAGRAAWRLWRDRSAAPVRRWVPAAGVIGVLAIAGVTTLPYAVGKAGANIGDLVEGEPEWLDATRDAAAYVETHDEQRFYGDDWWSAPVVSLMSGVDFYDLNQTDVCSLDPARDRLVWDYDAKTRLRPEPWTRNGRLAFEEVATFGEHVSIYAVGPGQGRCS